MTATRPAPVGAGSGTPSRAALLVVALAFFTDTFLYYLVVPLLPTYARTLGLSAVEVGALFASYSVALLVSTFPLGALADRVGRRRPMLWGLWGLGATTVAFAYAGSYPLLVVARVLQGLAAAATWTAGLALLADHFPAAARGRAMGTAFAFANLGVLLGPPVSGTLVEAFGPRAPFLLAAGLALVDACARAMLLSDVPFTPGPRAPARALLREPGVALFAGVATLGAGLPALLESLLPLDLDGRLGLSPRTIGFLFAGLAVAHTLTSPLMGALSDRAGRERVVAIGLGLCLVLVPLPAVLSSLPLLAVAMMAAGSAFSFVLAPASPGLADAVERSGVPGYGSAFAILNVSYSAGMMAGPLLGSALASAFGLRAALAACAGLALLYLVPLRAARRPAVRPGAQGRSRPAS